MKRNIVLVLFFACMLLASLTATAGDDFVCTPANVAGTWGYIETATVFVSGVGYPYASVGIYALDKNGNLTGKRTASAAGTILRASIVGTATVNPDCSGTETLDFYDEAGNFAGTAVKALTYVNKAREVNKIITSSSVPIVAITKARKVIPGRKDLLNLDGDDNGIRAFGCSNEDLAGEWGTSMTGTVLTSPTSSIQFGTVNKAVYDSEGNFWGTQIRSVNGTVSTTNFQGTYTIYPDCTGTKTGKTYDLAGNLLNTLTQDFVLLSEGKEIFEIFTSNIRADGVAMPTVATGHSQKTEKAVLR